MVTGTAASYSLDLTKAWAITGGFEHHWNANWRTSLWGDYGHVGYSTGVNSASAYLGYTVERRRQLLAVADRLPHSVDAG